MVNPDSPDARNLKPLSDQNRLKRGDLIRVMTAGGGGWGDPLERPAENVLDDVQDGFVSRESAFRDYGVVLDENDQNVNEEETAKLRKTRKCRTGMFHRRGRYYESLEPFQEGEGATDA